MSYFVLMLVIVAVAGTAIFLGITLAKRKSAAESRGTGSGEQ